MVTYIRCCLIFIFLFFFTFEQNIFFKIALLIFLFNVILDCVDGDLARKNDNASFWGKFLDGFIDSLGYALIPIAGGINILMHDYNGGELFFIILMILSTTLVLIENFLRERVSFYREWIRNNEKKIESNLFFKQKTRVIFPRLFIDTVHIISFVAIFFISNKFYFITIASIYSVVSIIRIIDMILLASRNLRIYRKSSFKIK